MLLAPSERVLLDGDRFVGAPSLTTGKEELLLKSDRKVALNPLAERTLAAAVLGAERAGALKLELRQRKALFGLRTVTELYAVRNGATDHFPEGSLEQSFARHFADGERVVSALLHDAMEEDSGWPAAHALFLVKRGLSARGLLETEERKRLKLFTTSRLIATDALRELASRESGEGEQALLAACERERPEIWKRLTKEIDDALVRRREVSDSGPDID
jgi:hypothetical protein